jgi:hypothetical protein
MDFQAAPADKAVSDGAKRIKDLQVLEIEKSSIRHLKRGRALGETKAEMETQLCKEGSAKRRSYIKIDEET